MVEQGSSRTNQYNLHATNIMLGDAGPDQASRDQVLELTRQYFQQNEQM